MSPILAHPLGTLSGAMGEYYLLEELGVGGMAQVFLAERRDDTDDPTKRYLAIKSLLAAHRENPEARMLFEYEARICKQLRHPNIPQALELIRVGNELHIVFEFVDGQNLGQLAARLREADRKIPVECSLQVITEVARALSYAHEKTDDETGAPLAIVHRDVTPRNIMVTFTGHTKLLDFGIARARNRQQITEDGFFRGTRQYAAPEHLAGGQVDARTDIYAVGAVLEELLGVTDLGMRPGRQSDATALHAVNGDITQRAIRICGRCTAVKPEERYQTSKELLRDLEGLVRDAGGAAKAVKRLAELMKEVYGGGRIEEMQAIEDATPTWEDRRSIAIARERRQRLIRFGIFLAVCSAAYFGFTAWVDSHPDASGVVATLTEALPWRASTSGGQCVLRIASDAAGARVTLNGGASAAAVTPATIPVPCGAGILVAVDLPEGTAYRFVRASRALSETSLHMDASLSDTTSRFVAEAAYYISRPKETFVQAAVDIAAWARSWRKKLKTERPERQAPRVQPRY